MLRFAGGLDRSNSQQIISLGVSLDDDDAVFRVVSDEHPEVDIWAALRRAEPLEKSLGRRIAIEWQPASPAPQAGGKHGDSHSHHDGQEAREPHERRRGRDRRWRCSDG